MAALSAGNYSFTAIGLAWALCLAPHTYTLLSYERFQKSQPKEVQEKYFLNRRQPRNIPSLLEGNKILPAETKDRLARAYAASLNGYENLGFFAAAVVAANMAMLTRGEVTAEMTRKINILSLGYCLSRVGFCVSYTLGAWGPHRGVYFYSGVGICIYMFSMAGTALTEVMRK